MQEMKAELAIQCLKKVDEKVYLQFNDLYQKRFYSFAFHYLKSHDLTQDAAQEVSIKLWEHLQEIDYSVKGLLFTSIHNYVMNMIRNHKRTIKKNMKQTIK